MANPLLSGPSLSGTMAESSLYQIMATGLTDSVLLLGHADAQVMYEPYQVYDPKKAVEFLNSDSNSPLLRAFLELYNAGVKDIWLMAVAPMSEYEDVIADRLTAQAAFGGKTFYQKYYDRLTTAYSVLTTYELAEIIVPVEAVYYDAGGVDFLTQLISFCSTYFSTTGAVCLGVLGTRISAFSDSSVTLMASDSRLASLGADGKFVMVVVGEGVITNPQMSTSYIAPLATKVAALMSVTSLDRSVAGLIMQGVSTMVGNDLNDIQLDKLTQAKLNPVGRTTRGKRGYAYQIRLLSDNTLGQDGSDFWSMTQMHLVANVLNQIRDYGYAFIGTTYFAKFKDTVYHYLNGLIVDNIIKDFSLNISSTNNDQSATVMVSLLPIFGLRQITFSIEVGPGT